MRNLFPLLLFFLIILGWCQKNISYPQSSNFTGTFSHLTDVSYSPGYKSEEDCIAEWGSYFDELCTMSNDAKEYISITVDTGGNYDISAQTVGSDQFSCFFEGKAEQISPTQLQSIVKTPDGEGNEDAETCVVTVTVSGDSASLGSSDGSSCRYFCGARSAYLELFDIPRE